MAGGWTPQGRVPVGFQACSPFPALFFTPWQRVPASGGLLTGQQAGGDLPLGTWRLRGEPDSGVLGFCSATGGCVSLGKPLIGSGPVSPSVKRGHWHL